MSQLTSGVMVKLKPGKNGNVLELPRQFFDVIKCETALVILSSNEAVRIIPTRGAKVFKVLVNLGEKLSPNFLIGLKNFFEETKVTPLFTSGLCLKDKNCIYELYCPAEQIDENQLIKKLEKLESVKKVEVQTLTP
ncbi:MAG: hypothetical protein QXO71_03555 [Candidatus Jordarchaeaceae archaeon]